MHVNSRESVFQTHSKEGCANSRCYRRNNRVSADEEVRIKDFGGGEVGSNGICCCGGNIRGRVLYLNREDPNKQCVVMLFEQS